jgi:putative acetyltransferase
MDAAARVLRRAFDDRLPWLAGRHSPQEDRDFFRHVVFPHSILWGAGDPELAGFLALRDGWVDLLYVLPEHQGCGIGSALLARAKDHAPTLRLWTFQRNSAARSFYERQGFRLVAETDGARNEEREPDALYRWARSRGDGAPRPSPSNP